MSGEEWAKARRLLNDPRTLNHLDWLHEQLEQAVAEPLLREALGRLWYKREQLRRPPRPGETEATRAYWAMLVAVEQQLCQLALL